MSVSSARRAKNLKFYRGRDPKYCDLKLSLGSGLKFYLSRDMKFRRRGENFKFIQSAAEFYEKILKFRRATSAKGAKTAIEEPLCR